LRHIGIILIHRSGFYSVGVFKAVRKGQITLVGSISTLGFV